VLGAAQSQGLKVILQAGYAPSWSNGGLDDKHPPTSGNIQAYGNYVRALATYAHNNYPGTLVAIEYWNEPNLTDPSWGFFKGSTATYYTQLARAAWNTKKGISPAAADPAPEIQLWGGATSGEGEYSGGAEWGWLNEAISAGILSVSDAWSCHPYYFTTGITYTSATATNNPWGWGRAFWNGTDNLATKLAAAGYTGLIHGTEWGVPTDAWPSGTRVSEGGFGTTSELDSAYTFRDGWPLWKAQPRAGFLFWYTMKDSNSAGTTTREDHFGVYRSDWSGKPSYNQMLAAPNSP
jgi:hypothetical protein